ncbi:MAG: endonuclease domain-containing protein [Hyphomonadaceae bacterium]|nr:endonuclease domain-containing protein [Hyphomonadaceae bacterium]
MTPNEAPTPPLPCGEGAGGEGRSNAPSLNQPAQKKLGHGYAPALGEERQKDHTRTKLRAARQRKEQTPSEKVLWKLLRSIEGHTFRRQVAMGDYVFDFGHYGARILIEIDGSIHRLPEVQANDRDKELFAVTEGFRVLRFANNDAWDRPAWVVERVREAIDRRVSDRPTPPNPLSARERGSEEP